MARIDIDVAAAVKFRDVFRYFLVLGIVLDAVGVGLITPGPVVTWSLSAGPG